MDTDQQKILIADPDCDRIEPLKHMLGENNYEVLTAGTAEQAWTSLMSDGPDLVLLEPMLPNGTEGFHVVWKLREFPDQKLSQIPVLVVSRIHQATKLNIFPNFHDGHYSALDFLPVQGFLDKPVENSTLIQNIDSTLTRSRMKLGGQRAQ